MENFIDIEFILENQRTYFNSQITKSSEFRINQLDILLNTINKNEKLILKALRDDLNKCEFEAYETEIGVVISEIKHVRKKIKKWNKVKKVNTPVLNIGSKSYIYSQPYGVCLIMAPWNYPFQLCISPLIGSIIGGNCSVIKPSELAPNTAKVIKKIINESFSKDYIEIIEGEIDTNKYLLKQNFDYIFFTGSPRVGKIVMKEASKNLTPVTLELGGKSPCIVDKNSDIDMSAKKIVWGKFLNAGQTCIAPDYIIAHENIKEKLIKSIQYYINEFYSSEPLKSKDYTSIVNENHFKRLKSLIDYEKIVYGGNTEENTLKIEPTIINNVQLDDKIMEEEIFGPILPILEFRNFNDLTKIISKHKNPLALYVFTNNKSFENDIINTISFGGGCVNDTIMHITNHNMPFGGVGYSGMGSYHGKRSFETFTHQKSIMKSSKIDIPIKYPPYSNTSFKLLKKVFKIF
ncbi:MAG: aldehyde dehydrogenase [Romboutsia sp.]